MSTVHESFLRHALAELLHVDPANLPAHANVFELGIDSLLALRLIRRLNAKLDADIDLESVFEHPTIAELAQLLATRTALAAADVAARSA